MIEIVKTKNNYHNFLCRFGHSKYLSDENLLSDIKQTVISIVGFCEHVPNPNIILPNEDDKLLLSEIDDYVSNILKLKELKKDLTILSGFEASFDPMIESFLYELHKKVDYMILNQQTIKRESIVSPNNNPYYPLEYANILVKAINSGIFDIVAYPDSFIKYRNTITDENIKQLFDENTIIASQIICEEASKMGIPIEISDETIQMNNQGLAKQYIDFWKTAEEIKGLRILYSQKPTPYVNENKNMITDILNIIHDKLITQEYNPAEARRNNELLQRAYSKSQNSALNYTTHFINSIISSPVYKETTDDKSDSVAISIGTALNNEMNRLIEMAHNKSVRTKETIKNIIVDESLSDTEKRIKLDRKREAIKEIDFVLANQKKLIELAKQAIVTSMEIGCETVDEYRNMICQLVELNTTNNQEHIKQIQMHISEFQKRRTGETTTNGGQYRPYHLETIMNNSIGKINIAVLVLILILIIIVGIGIGCVLYYNSN